MTQTNQKQLQALSNAISAITPLADALSRLLQGQAVIVEADGGSFEITVVGANLNLLFCPKDNAKFSHNANVPVAQAFSEICKGRYPQTVNDENLFAISVDGPDLKLEFMPPVYKAVPSDVVVERLKQRKPHVTPEVEQKTVKTTLTKK
ncbi:hypothetical protein [Enterobacter hormaechei]|uniref:hypothetical protein n=1 Tax=Enterobacter hormaechei TaxID=158836 RepID=UPI0026F245BF|nr:hypothetical protein [Enterobacter hormaechei]